MYEETFDREWRSLAREEAMFRAYALGVDAALGEEHPEEVDRLARETSRPLVQLAYDEGRSAAEERLGAGDSPPDDATEGATRERRLWRDLVEDRRDEAGALDLVPVAGNRLDPPGALSRPGALDPPDDEVGSIRLPRFLLD
ncbi:MAG: hypothetical protein ABEJ77_05380 [Halanaeroarchaeum sp.]